MNIIDFKVSVILALIGIILALLVSIFNTRLTRRREAEKEHERRKKEQYNKWLGSGGLPLKDEIKAARIARSEGRKVSLLSPSGGIVLLLLIFFVSSISYFFISPRPMQPVPNMEITIPTIIGGPTLDGTTYPGAAVITTMTAAPASTAESAATPIPGLTMVILPSDTTIPYTPIAQPPILTPILVASASFTPTSTTGSPIPTPSPAMTTAPVTESLLAAAPSASVTISVTPSSVNVGENAVVRVSLSNVPAGGYASAEFTCTYDTNLVAASAPVPGDLFGFDPVTAFNMPQNSSFIFAIAGSNGKKAITSGTAFTFDVFGLQAGQAAIECAVRVSKGDGVLTSLSSTGTILTVTGAAPTATTTATAAETPTLVESPTATASTTAIPSGTPAPVETPTATASPTATPSVTPTPAESPTATATTTMTLAPTTESPVATPSSTTTPAPATKSPTATPSSTTTSAPFVQLLSAVYLQTDTDCQAWIGVQVSGSPVTGQFHVRNAFFGSVGDTHPPIILPPGANNYQVGLGRSRDRYSVWFEYNRTSSNIIDLICPDPIGIDPAPSFTPASFIGLPTTSNISLTPTLSPNPTRLVPPSFSEIDKLLLQETMKSYIVYTKPNSMKLYDTFTIELSLNPSLLPGDLVTAIVGTRDLFTTTPEPEISITDQVGNLVTSTPAPSQYISNEGVPFEFETSEVEITNRLIAELRSNEPDAFTVQPLDISAEQVISPTQTTTWRWSITAQKVGTKTLELVIYRLVKVDGNEHWRAVETYSSDIVVRVTPMQWLLDLDWKWLIGIAVSLLLIPAFWRWIDQRNKRSKSAEVPVSKYAPLKKFFVNLPKTHQKITLTFAEIEEILKDNLPASARRYKGWWANDIRGRHVQASAWLDAGWKVKSVELTNRRVHFARA